MSENVVVLPGTRWQIPLVKRLKRRGYRVTVLDWYENQPAYEYADDYRLVDILDKERVLEIALDVNAIAVISDECDIATKTVAWVSEKLGKYSIGEELADLYTNKYSMRLFCQEHGFPCPRFFKCYTIDEAVQAFEQVNKKMIIKPLDSNSSRGVFSIYDVEDLKNKFQESIKYSKTEKAVILEEFIEGEEFSIDSINDESEYYPLAISRKVHFSFNENLDQELIFMHDDNRFDYNLLRNTNRQYVDATGLKKCLTHAEYKYCDGKYYLIEIGARGGGNLISGVINPCLTCIETQEYLIDWALGEKTMPAIRYDEDVRDRCASLYFIDIGEKEGVIKNIRGTEVFDNDCVKSFWFFKKEGDYVKPAKDGGTRLGYYIISCQSQDELIRMKNKINCTLTIEIDGNSGGCI